MPAWFEEGLWVLAYLLAVVGCVGLIAIGFYVSGLWLERLETKAKWRSDADKRTREE